MAAVTRSQRIGGGPRYRHPGGPRSRAYTDFDHPEASYFKGEPGILNALSSPWTGRRVRLSRDSPVNTSVSSSGAISAPIWEPLPITSVWRLGDGLTGSSLRRIVLSRDRRVGPPRRQAEDADRPEEIRPAPGDFEATSLAASRGLPKGGKKPKKKGRPKPPLYKAYDLEERPAAGSGGVAAGGAGSDDPVADQAARSFVRSAC